MHSQSSWLQRFGVPIEVTEINASSSSISSDAEGSKTLFTADVPIVVCNPVSTPLASILPASSTVTLPLPRENTVLTIVSPSSQLITSTSRSEGTTVLSSPESLRVLFVDPARAIHGLDVLADGSASSLSVQRYQDDASGSNVASVTNAVKDILSSVPSSSVAAVHAQTGRALIKDALATAHGVLRKAKTDADTVLTSTSSLRSQMEEAKAKAHLEVFGAGKDGDEITKAVAQAKRSVQPTMDTLQWYKLFWRVDDVREVVTAAVDRAWCRDLERKVRANLTIPLGFLLISHAARVPRRPSRVLASVLHILCDCPRAFLPAQLPIPLPSTAQRARAHRLIAFIRPHPSRPNLPSPRAPGATGLPDGAPTRVRAARRAQHEWERAGGPGHRVGGVGDGAAAARGHDRHRDGHGDRGWRRDARHRGGRAVGGRAVGAGEEAVVEGLGPGRGGP